MKKRLLTILLIFICLLTVACGKKKEEEEGIKTLTCVAELDDQKMESTVVVDTRTGEVSKVSIKMSVPKSFYASFNYTDAQLIEALCNNEGGYFDNCNAEIDGATINSSFDYVPSNYQKELEKEYNTEKIDKSILEQMKTKSEENGSKCTIS